MIRLTSILLLVVSTAALASRTVYVTPNFREAKDPGTNNGSETVILYCTIVNPSSRTQTITINGIQLGYFSSGTKNTQNAPMPQIGPIALLQHESYTTLWSSTTGPPNGFNGSALPKTFWITVSEDTGIVTGSCDSWYVAGPTGVGTGWPFQNIISKSYFAINAGRPF